MLLVLSKIFVFYIPENRLKSNSNAFGRKERRFETPLQ